MKIFPGRHPFQLFFDVADGGGSGNGQQQSGASGADAGGQQQQARSQGGQQPQQSQGRSGGGQQQAGGAGGPVDANGSAVRFSDDTRIQMEDGRVISGREYRAEMQQGWERDHGQRFQKGYDLLVAEARRLDGLQRQSGQQQQRQPQRDAFADVEDAPVIDGATFAKLSRQGFGGIAQQMQQLSALVARQQQMLQQVQGHIGTSNEERASTEFQGRLDKALGTVEIKGFTGRVDVKDPAIRQVAENLYLSYEPDSWRPGEYEKMLGDTLSNIYAGFMRMQKSAADTGRERVRAHFNPAGGQGTPRGQQQYKFERGRDIAATARAMGLWGGGQSAT